MNRSILKPVVMVLVVMGIFLLAQRPAMSMDARMVRIYGASEEGNVATQIEPKNIWIGRNTTVIWTNMSDADVRIIFAKGKECKEGTRAALGWKLDEQECYLTATAIPPGGTSSANFGRTGKYEYEVDYVGKNMKEKGSIVVAKESADEMIRY
jgi:hypothetical protein